MRSLIKSLMVAGYFGYHFVTPVRRLDDEQHFRTVDEPDTSTQVALSARHVRTDRGPCRTRFVGLHSTGRDEFRPRQPNDRYRSHAGQMSVGLHDVPRQSETDRDQHGHRFRPEGTDDSPGAKSGVALIQGMYLVNVIRGYGSKMRT